MFLIPRSELDNRTSSRYLNMKAYNQYLIGLQYFPAVEEPPLPDSSVSVFKS